MLQTLLLPGKTVDLLAEGSLALDDSEFIDAPLGNARVNRLRCDTGRPGGLGLLACQAVRLFDPNARLSCFGLMGQLDQDQVLEAVRSLHLEPTGLTPVEGKRTNRSLVIQDPHGNRLIERLTREIQPDVDATPRYIRRLRGMIHQSKAFLTRHTHVPRCRALLKMARKHGCYAGLVPGEAHLPHLADLPAHLMICNSDEAAAKVGHDCGNLKSLFDEYADLVPSSEHLLMTTGPGPIFVADRVSRERYTVDPISLPPSPDGCVRSVGCGDTLVGTICFLMGQPERLVGGPLLREAIQFAQQVVAVHMTANPHAAQKLRAEYARIAPLFQPPVQEAAGSLR